MIIALIAYKTGLHHTFDNDSKVHTVIYITYPCKRVRIRMQVMHTRVLDASSLLQSSKCFHGKGYHVALPVMTHHVQLLSFHITFHFPRYFLSQRGNGPSGSQKQHPCHHQIWRQNIAFVHLKGCLRVRSSDSGTYSLRNRYM